MNRILKRSFALAGVIGLLAFCATPAQAQFFGGLYGSQTLFPFAATNYNTTNSAITGTWNYTYPLPPATSTNAVFPAVPTKNNRYVALTLQASGTTNTATVSIAIVRSQDGIIWETTPYVLLSASCATGAATVTSTNFDMGEFGYWTALNFTNSAGISNALVQYAIKPGF